MTEVNVMTVKIGRLHISLHLNVYKPSCSFHWEPSRLPVRSKASQPGSWNWEIFVYLACAKRNREQLLYLLNQINHQGIDAERAAELLIKIDPLSPEIPLIIQLWLERQIELQLSLSGKPALFLGLLQTLNARSDKWTLSLLVWISQNTKRPLQSDQGKLHFFAAWLLALNQQHQRSKKHLEEAKDLLPENTPFFSRACLQLERELDST